MRTLLDQLISGRQQRFWNGKAERFGGFEVDDQLDLRNLLDRQIGWFLAFENAPSIDANLVERTVAAAAMSVSADSMTLRSLRPFDCSTRMIFWALSICLLTVLGGLAEFERDLIRARTGEGRKRAMAAGVKFGKDAENRCGTGTSSR